MNNRTERYLEMFWVLCMLIGCVGMGYGIGERIEKNRHKTKQSPTYVFADTQQSLNLSPDNLYHWLIILDVQYPEIALKQSIQECGWQYDSYRAVEFNNLFGFQISNSNVLTFGHWLGSVIYYKKWQDKYYEGGDYYEFLKRYEYAEDSLYIEKLKNINVDKIIENGITQR